MGFGKTTKTELTTRAQYAKFKEVAAEIVGHCASTFGMDPQRVYSRDRSQRVASCRQVAMYLGRRITDVSYPALGKFFNRDHSTTIHACNLIERRMRKEPEFRKLIENIAGKVTMKMAYELAKNSQSAVAA